MNFETWKPIYEAIRADFGYDRAADRRARDALAGLLDPFDLERLDASGETLAIVGGAEAFERDRHVVESADTVFAASNAAATLRDRGLAVDCMVTDLDKVPEVAVDLTEEGTPVAVHAHGDNVAALEEWVPQMAIDSVLGTTQVEPAPPVRNFGGFTDGDRAAFLADALGADRLVFPCWDFEDASVSETKRRKLRWAARLLAWLEERRGERFDVLDGYRTSIDRLDVPE